MPAGIKIGSDFPNDLQKGLIEQVAKGQKVNRVYVGQFNRYGYSGASLLLIYFSDKPAGIPYLLKVTPLEKAKAEFAAVNKFRHQIPDAELEAWQLYEQNDGIEEWGALLYKHHGSYGPGQFATDPRALRHIIYGSSAPVEQLLAKLRDVFDKLKNVHVKLVSKEVELKSEDGLGRYLRKCRADDKIRTILGKGASENAVDFLGTSIENPISYLKALPQFGTLDIATIHGDLHPDNVILAPDDSAHIIDFAWARDSQDVLIDYVLLETSIRFNLFPRPINLNDQLIIDRALLFEEDLDITTQVFEWAGQRDAYIRMWSAVQTIRERARQLLGPKFTIERYLLTQFIVLYGLLAYDQYEPYVSTRALGMIAKQLKDAGQLSFCRDA